MDDLGVSILGNIHMGFSLQKERGVIGDWWWIPKQKGHGNRKGLIPDGWSVKHGLSWNRRWFWTSLFVWLILLALTRRSVPPSSSSGSLRDGWGMPPNATYTNCFVRALFSASSPGGASTSKAAGAETAIPISATSKASDGSTPSNAFR